MKSFRDIDAQYRDLTPQQRVQRVQEAELRMREKAVLLCLVLADGNKNEKLSRGVSMALASISTRTSISIATVRRTIRRLEEEDGRLVVYQGYGRIPSVYFLNLDRDDEPTYGLCFHMARQSLKFLKASGEKAITISRAVNRKRQAAAARMKARAAKAPKWEPFDPNPRRTRARRSGRAREPVPVTCAADTKQPLCATRWHINLAHKRPLCAYVWHMTSVSGSSPNFAFVCQGSATTNQVLIGRCVPHVGTKGVIVPSWGDG